MTDAVGNFGIFDGGGDPLRNVHQLRAPLGAYIEGHPTHEVRLLRAEGSPPNPASRRTMCTP
jgi:hypothetical protein